MQRPPEYAGPRSRSRSASDAASSPRKHDLAFILNERLARQSTARDPLEAVPLPLVWTPTSTERPARIDRRPRPDWLGSPPRTHASPPRPRPQQSPQLHPPSTAATASAEYGVASPPPSRAAAKRPRSSAATTSREDRKRSRMCKVDGCENYIVHKGLCCRHGGGKKCSVDGCDTSAKHRGRCWKHGGSTGCKTPNCTKRAKARGLCWAHGGGTQCGADGCEKVSVSNGFCWAHGGGKRCIYDGCQRPAYERTHNFCVKHHAELQHVDYFEV